MCSSSLTIIIISSRPCATTGHALSLTRCLSLVIFVRRLWCPMIRYSYVDMMSSIHPGPRELNLPTKEVLASIANVTCNCLKYPLSPRFEGPESIRNDERKIREPILECSRGSKSLVALHLQQKAYTHLHFHNECPPNPCLHLHFELCRTNSSLG